MAPGALGSDDPQVAIHQNERQRTLVVAYPEGVAHGDDRELLGVSREIFHRGQPIHRDHIYRITAVYDNPTGEPIRGAMGKIGGLFMPQRGQRLPSIDHSHPEYIEDWHAMVDHEHEMDHVRAAEQSAPLERDGG
ncbi:MAG: hypothetical protein EA351_02360 [Gemmatimonadales bacterium]|nr:MAG: hypothetical protein EA351_02360 [Gemmatimonadales bacterium]